MNQIPSSFDDPAVEYERAVNEAVALVKGRLLSAEHPNLPPPDPTLKQELEHAARLFNRAVQLTGENWNAMWFLGKIHQRLRNPSEAFFWFQRAHEANVSNVEIAREASISATECGKLDVAIKLAKRAVELRPNDAGLLANVSHDYLLAGRLPEAEASINESLRLSPRDQVTIRLRNMVQHFKNKRRVPPNTGEELVRYWDRAHKWYRRWSL